MLYPASRTVGADVIRGSAAKISRLELGRVGFKERDVSDLLTRYGVVDPDERAEFLTLVGRSNDLIISAGYNVYPQVVERVVNACPGVRESAVVGVPDRLRGESVAVFVVRDVSNPDPLDEDRLRTVILVGIAFPVAKDEIRRNA